MDKSRRQEVIKAVRSTLALLLDPEQLAELRVLNSPKGTVSGYFTDHDKLAAAAADWDGKAPGAYVIIDAIAPDLLARSANCVTFYAKHTTADSNITRRRWFKIDLDPQRNSGISATDAEHQAALDRATRVREWLLLLGFPPDSIILADSGNGAHLLVRIDLPNDRDSAALIKRCLAALDLRFTDEVVGVDQSISNAARIWKLYGTQSCKGSATPDRPHRRSRILHAPPAGRVAIASREVLEQLAAHAPAKPKAAKRSARSGESFDLENWIAAQGLEVAHSGEWSGQGHKWVLRQCPWNPAHDDGAAYIVRFTGGEIAAGCHHNGCAGKDWKALREAIEPGYQDRPRQERKPQRTGSQRREDTEDDAEPVDLLDFAPETLRRPLALIGGHGYAATWVWTRSRSSGAEEQVLVIVRDDGVAFSAAPVRGVRPLAELGLTVQLSEIPPDSRLWSGAGLGCYLKGERPRPAEVFRQVREVVDRFLDFRRSLADQGTMCDLTACYVLGSYLLDAFNVIGYLWPNGGKGSGKTSYLLVVGELGYLGQVILAGGSYPTLRDFADYGAVLAFDDAENIMDPKRTDPDKRTLLLAGNRRGASVSVKEPAGKRGWVTRHVSAFCPRLFSAIRLPDDVLASRSITIPLVRSQDRQREAADPMNPDDWPHERRALIDDLWATGLSNLPLLRKYDALAARRARLSGRNLEPWRAMLTVALWLQQEHGVTGLFDRLEALSVAYQGERGDLEADDPTRVLLMALRDRVAGTVGIQIFETSELADRMNRLAHQMELAGPDMQFTNAKSVGWQLKGLRFEKETATHERRRWRTTAVEVEQLCRSYGIPALPARNAENVENAMPAASEPTDHRDADGAA